ncbi:MAG: COX15/CtaA family protein [Alphaproteobacteria bacterium]|nr:COX15/CtaA family protein [Alphaproteobacteria bacterium]MBV9376392.1 COX15/CtaA family protein [Alphaproteobacteria bacterium]
MSSATSIANSGPGRWAAADKRLQPVAVWLFLCCGLIFLMVVVGGVTRLTLSGLSITEWKPVIGIVPPLSASDWAAEFAKYQQIPEYRAIHFAMSLDEFKSIYYWEYFHRLLGRLIGIVFGVPFLWFLARRQLPRRLAPPLAGILLLGFLQGLLGWYMVKSGLADRVEVSQYRLTAHFALALTIYAAILWTALGLVRSSPFPAANRGWRRASEAVLVLTALTIVAGGFVAGTRAGLTYNTFPLMDGRLVPAGYAQLQPLWLNWFENIAAVQFDHRALAVTTAITILLLWVAGIRGRPPKSARIALHLLLAATAVQLALGISTLLQAVPVPLGAAHQAGAILLLTAAIFLRHTLRPARV